MSEPLTKELIKEVGKNEILTQCGLFGEMWILGQLRAVFLQFRVLIMC